MNVFQPSLMFPLSSGYNRVVVNVSGTTCELQSILLLQNLRILDLLLDELLGAAGWLWRCL
jgi:hypothetical protein